MNRRRQRQVPKQTQNLDSFLDILTNTVGVLMFVGLFISLISVQASTKIRTPLVAKSEKTPHFFEVRGNRIINLENPASDRQILLARSSLQTCDRPNVPTNIDPQLNRFYSDKMQEHQICVSQNAAQIRKFQTETPHYKIHFVDPDTITYEPHNANVGESIREIAQKDSEYKTILSKLDPKTEYLAFIVRPDSFPGFRAARQQAWQAGFDVGWEPKAQKNPININVAGSGGRAVGVQ
jgi:hypothetical protein